MTPSPVIAACPLPAQFWTIRDNLVKPSTIRYCNAVATRRTGSLNAGIDTVMSKFSSGANPVFYEIFDYQPKLNLYFDLDKAWDGVPTIVECNRVLEAALDFLRGILGSTTTFAVSQSHRRNKISFHIVCPLISAHRLVSKQIVQVSELYDLGLDIAVYNSGRQLMRSAFAMGEKADSVPLTPVYPYIGVFSDHIVQAVSQNARLVSLTEIPKPVPRAYVSSHGFIEDLISNIEFGKISHANRLGLIARLKVENLRSLFDFKMTESDALCGQSNKERLDLAWRRASVSSPVMFNEIATILRIQNTVILNQVLLSHSVKETARGFVNVSNDSLYIDNLPFGGFQVAAYCLSPVQLPGSVRPSSPEPKYKTMPKPIYSTGLPTPAGFARPDPTWNPPTFPGMACVVTDQTTAPVAALAPAPVSPTSFAPAAVSPPVVFTSTRAAALTDADLDLFDKLLEGSFAELTRIRTILRSC